MAAAAARIALIVWDNDRNADIAIRNAEIMVAEWRSGWAIFRKRHFTLLMEVEIEHI